MTYQGYNFLFALPFSGQPCSFGRSVYRSVHDSIMPNKTKVILKTASSDIDKNKPLRVVRSVLQEPRSNQGPKVLLLDFYLPIT